MVVVEKVAVAPVGRPAAARMTVVLKPPLTAVVMTVVAEPPCAAETEAGVAVMVKSGTTVTAQLVARAAAFTEPRPVARSPQ